MSDRTCPSLAELIDRAEGRRLAFEHESHLAAGCPDCVRREDVLATVLRVASAEAWTAPPPAWRERAAALVPAAPPEGAPRSGVAAALGRTREIVAGLARELGRAPEPALALRGPGAAERHLLYRAGPLEIDLALLDSGALVGQVVSSDEDEAALARGVCVLYGGGAPRETPLEDGGDFHFEAVSPGAYDLLLESPDLRVFVPDLDLAPRASGGAP